MGCIESKQEDNSASFDHLFKLVLVGEGGVGKSSLIVRFADKTFVEEDIASIGADFKVKFLNVNKSRLKLQIWDTAGQEKFRQMTSSYFAGASAVIVVFDLTNEGSFKKVEKWIEEAKSFTDNQPQNGFAGRTNNNPIAFLIIGNKKDLADARAVNSDAAAAIAQRVGGLYFETSAKTDPDSVDEAFKALATKLKDDADPVV